MQLEEILAARRDTRHFTDEVVPDEVLERALRAGHMAPSVGLTDATRYYVVKSKEVKQEIKKLFQKYNRKAADQIEDEAQKTAYAVLKLEAIVDAPLGLVVCYDRSVLNSFTIGTVASNDTIRFSAVCAVQNIWLSLTEQGYSMGWVSILDYYEFKNLLGLPEDIEPLSYFCVGKPATDYDKQPMLQQQGWKQKSAAPSVMEVEKVHLPVTPAFEPPHLHAPQNELLAERLQYIIDHKTKPTGALGVLEDLALQIGKVFNTTAPEVKHPHLVVFAADHGIAQHGVSAYPQEVTSQMVKNFIEGGAAINAFCQQHHITLSIVDAGVNYDFPPNLPILHHKMGRGTHSFLHGPAMTRNQVHTCLQKGSEVTTSIYQTGCNTIGFGEMGIGNTSTAAVLMSLLCHIPIEQCIGKGTGVVKEKLEKKQQLLKQAIENYQGEQDSFAILAHFGGFEILQMAGAMLQAKRKDMLLLIDGFISSVAFLCAYKIEPKVKENAVFCHQSDEAGHRLLLQTLGVNPLLQLGMRLGEGTGCAVAFPLLKSATAFLNEMASFERAGVSNKA
ncbi:nicotinate-nucleotide--dimethylbenzimidazole phosphoribosyltransferase [Pontibacter diazotrophicus]|uniref:Nicotinate-nucleotide--dimethylbenzimidazole phosphoribosyltransferase n=1 Tax=Pontibacter diazotrophicus TaxID=1400979 RepID=A0A3D8L1R2_9BACT|nr:nicotinate-nucleotide--dimethylbenzimidazole phosphoribosyltransferase [Pontibacter diazotrophicus]